MAKKKESVGLEILRSIPLPKTEEQEQLLASLDNNQVTLVTGPAGTGKTFLSTIYGLYHFLTGKYDKIVFTRPCVEANSERLGFLPNLGTCRKKLLLI